MLVLHRRGRSGGGAATRAINVFLGVWLVISAFVWPHTRVQMNNTWIFGAIVVVCAALATVVPRIHHLNALAAFWLFVSAARLPSLSAATVWNNMLVAVAIFIVSLMETDVEPPGSHPSGTLPAPRS